MKRILITGSNSQLAIAFKKLFHKKYKLILKDKVSMDVSNEKLVNKCLIKENPDIIIYCSALTNVDLCEKEIELSNKINGYSVDNFSKNFDGLFIYISTDYVFDGKNGPYNEDSKTNPINAYGKSKLLGEEIVKKTFANYLIIRTNVVFDIGYKASFLDWVVKSLISKKNITVVNDQINNPIWTHDLANAIDYLIKEKFYGLIHVGSDFLCSRYKFAQIIAKKWKFNQGMIKPISTVQLESNVKSYIAKRPLKSGLISKYNFLPKISLDNSLDKIKKY
jgi:dTDP-4-dehydrorhamnose reductase